MPGDFSRQMIEIEEALARGEREGLDYETLVQIEMAAANLPAARTEIPLRVTSFNADPNRDFRWAERTVLPFERRLSVASEYEALGVGGLYENPYAVGREIYEKALERMSGGGAVDTLFVDVPRKERARRVEIRAHKPGEDG